MTKKRSSGETIISSTSGDGSGGGHVIRVNDVDAPNARPALNFLNGEGISFDGNDDAGDDETELTANLDINSLSEDTVPDSAADYIPTYDASAGTSKKVKLENLPGGGVSGGVNATIRVAKWRMFT